MSIDAIKPHDITMLYTIADPNIADRVILDLAGVLHRQARTGSSSISWQAQVDASRFYVAHGLEAALTLIANECAVTDK